MKRLATAVVLIPVVLAVVLRAPLPLLAVVVAAVAVLTTREFLDLAQHYGVQPFRKPTYVFVILVFAAVALGSVGGQSKPLMTASATVFGVGMAVVLAVFVFLAAGMLRGKLATGLPAAATSVFALAYIAIPLAMLVQLRGMWVTAVPGALWVVYLLVVVWVGDTFAYYVGRAVGRHKLAPRISPGKTWEGTIASFVGSIAAGTLVMSKVYAISRGLAGIGLLAPAQTYRAFVEPELGPVIVLSAGINIAAQLGDLAESLIKRGAGVKDSGALLPGHGGMLDRIDALLFAAPVLWYYAVLRVMS
jgi:phosphatidate cytidylyltransferase